MESSVYGSGDPWENGWINEEEDNAFSGEQGIGSGSGMLTGSTMDTGMEDPSGGSAYPGTYYQVGNSLGDKIRTEQDVHSKVLDKLEERSLLTSYQSKRIVDTLSEHHALPILNQEGVLVLLGLLAMELDLAGTGDYVTVQMKSSDLPELPPDVVDLLLDNTSAHPQSEVFMDPLTSHLAESHLDSGDDGTWNDGLNHAGRDIKSPNITGSLLGNDPTFSEPLTHRNNSNSFTKPVEFINNLRDSFKPLVGSTALVNIKEVPEKEGLVFKHINYVITHNLALGMNGPGGTKKVLRRYSDFVWLLEYLLKKYPFRVIPGLPPKKFSVGPSPDSQFMQRRRRGLSRFLNQLVRHPILRSEPVVVTFLSVPTDIASWKKQARIDFSIEFKGKKIKADFINEVWPVIGKDFMKKWKMVEENMPNIISLWTKLVMLMERHERRQQQVSFDNNKFVEILGKFESLDANIYPHDDPNSLIDQGNKDDMSSINNCLSEISSYFTKSSQLLADESYAVNMSILEKFKNYLDYLYSFQELFERFQKLSSNTITQLQTRLKENEAKYSKLCNEDADMKGSDLAKLKQVIVNDKQEIFQQLNKDWLIKECCLQEYLLFQETQFLISELWSEWCKNRLQFTGKMNESMENLSSSILNDFPLSR